MQPESPSRMTHKMNRAGIGRHRPSWLEIGSKLFPAISPPIRKVISKSRSSVKRGFGRWFAVRSAGFSLLVGEKTQPEGCTLNARGPIAIAAWKGMY
jgi:hypothetical protein